MSLDPIADMLTCIRNAQKAKLDIADIPYSMLKKEISRILKKEGFIVEYVVEKGEKKILRIYLKYTDLHEPVICGVQRESKLGLRRYVAANKIPRVLGGLGVAILSTSSGVMTGQEAMAKHIGGEILCSVW